MYIKSKFENVIRLEDTLVFVILLILKAVLVAHPGELPSDKVDTISKKIIARVADREITYNDFIERSEYTIRPEYCKGSSNNDKNIVLNTLIAEKIFALEAGENNELLKSKKFQNFITGRREQKMRDLLYVYEGIKKVSLDTAEIKRIFSVAGRTYRVQYFNVSNKNTAESITSKMFESDSAFNVIFKNYTTSDTIPEREISWTSPEIPVIHKALFSDKLKKEPGNRSVKY